MADAGVEIIQVVRRAGPGGGVGGVAAALDDAFRGLGVRSRLVTAATLGRTIARRGRVGHALEVVGFTLFGSLAARRARNADAVVFVHGDALGGDVYVDHGLHKALLLKRPWLLLRNPLHGFLWLREEARHAWLGKRRVACLSDGAEAALRRCFPALRRAAVARLSNGVDIGRFHPDAARIAHAPGPKDCRLVFVGREFGRKGLRHVIEALPHLPAGVSLTVIGGGAREVARARRKAAALGVASRIRFLGVRNDVETWLRTSDILVLPSVWEASPLVALEAMASGVPVLLGGTPSGEALLGEGRGGLVIESNGPAVAAAVAGLMADPARFLALRRSARAWAEGFAWPRVAQRYLALAEDIRRERARR